MKLGVLFFHSPPHCQTLESCSIFSNVFIFPFSFLRSSALYLAAVFQALLCRVGENCTGHAEGVDSSKFAAPVLIPSLF